MKNDDLSRYINLRERLVREKAELEQRLQQINEALGDRSEVSRETASAVESPVRTGRAQGRRGRRNQGGLSLRDAVLQATASGPRTKEEILQAVKKLGYKFSTNNPMNSLGVVLYGKNPKFRNENGRFSPQNGSGSSQPRGAQGGSGGGAFARKRRQMSPEARERIAAAQRARWAKAKAGR